MFLFASYVRNVTLVSPFKWSDKEGFLFFFYSFFFASTKMYYWQSNVTNLLDYVTIQNLFFTSELRWSGEVYDKRFYVFVFFFFYDFCFVFSSFHTNRTKKFFFGYATEFNLASAFERCSRVSISDRILSALFSFFFFLICFSFPLETLIKHCADLGEERATFIVN